MIKADELTFNEAGLIPAIVQDAASKEVLTLAYMNKESFEKTLETKETWFFSRSRGELWHKGATSGNIQRVKDIRLDCDQDALIVLVEPAGPACHKGSYSCFSPGEHIRQTDGGRFDIINELETVIAKRQAEMPEGAYTTYLFREGVDKILKKVGEEAAEVIIAAKNRDPEELKWEAADLLYHLLVLLREQSLPLDDVLGVLKERHEGSES
ncbi:bifunctional phosphoribosyl-AMP cyclohydrolase/phosphoribosyl-ATP diphosphatase HisIE [Bacillus licheniformis]|jgi:phosphoribosyl-ATP pyrophosphohydrolase/phosphoribosyl-AMP cyclohydrolase|uniref:Histidine biosynthesis bifunctional protein HisIE n=2 Tax=Bacillus licheniformis TaxID=1402 RepID=Q65EG4_BACLD|nr:MULTISPECIES: bifunctional phosphoribosyl-AMP cyclohydrolase/phosphoribosyl-ATP diphosphatase HisIE [Bacillus]MBJ7888255.1 bifunctional phosphoribosyl-AMP cyclohydrolase/phosphoribosyl-ATP diphosphatase HisIE [Bacillaceae bacterium HSR45]MBY8348124.1 bifunctional phosphoribosyl-AMP cyclohydrolase/phosphoribosyl-ATP diphosphatase HisIE [Bacillus sp. PCH94]MDP4080136.1 bifunctional phosphoribosyl-AMP cyclohydrolase/phosphoribosyl-ATP diphosphatase HisIE [Bacillota bacterium]AAU25179.1 phosphor